MWTAQQIVTLHDDTTRLWHVRHESFPQLPPEPVLQFALDNHRANFDLWHEEDKARDTLATDAQIATVKHAIDGLNQRRNDIVELLDTHLLAAATAQSTSATLHSETPGLIIDRLSILSLKIFHTREESVRTEATEQHRQRNTHRLSLLEEQRIDLAACLDVLWTEVLAGTRRFKLYRQMKMYNDPELNPVLYAQRNS